ncbi:MAG: hypothetical protein CMK74_02280 [Pseudomonadales bacterium]|nr:hypothetical protein [Pseudomonadales bacterium]|tara:strand:- start:578 stop:1096 length:519 start_codon:yes stop_codon:yes gene_type:complete
MQSVKKVSELKMKGTLTIHHRDLQGNIIWTWSKRNTITFDAGDIVRALMAQRVADTAAVELQWGSMRFGTSNLAPTRYDTDLIAEETALRKALLDTNKVDGISGEITLQTTMLSTEGNTKVFQEAGVFTLGAGVFNDAVGGSLQMWARQVHAAFTKSDTFSVDYSWTFQFTT